MERASDGPYKAQAANSSRFSRDRGFEIRCFSYEGTEPWGKQTQESIGPTRSMSDADITLADRLAL